jgi:hypothetical protein
LIANSIEIEAKEGLKNELIQASMKMNQEFLALLKQGKDTILTNAGEGAKKAYKEFVENAFEQSLSGYKDALKSVLGESFKDYIDNLVASKADDMIKGIVKDYVDQGVIEGINTAPDLKNLSGPWGEGTFTINEVIMTDEFKKEMEKQGCDFSEVEKQKGKAQKMNITLNPTSESGGNMVFQMVDGEPQTIPFTYTDGAIKATFSKEGATMNMNMNVTEENGKYVSKGGLDVDYQGGGLKIKADTSTTKAIPKPVTPTTPAGTTTPTPATK